MTMYRQGDVLLIKVDALPRKAKELKPDGGRVVLAYGEVTGHAHAFYPEVIEREPTLADKIIGRKAANEPELKVKLWDAGAERFLQALDNTQLKHEEHAPINVEKGVYKVVRQREYDPEREHFVAD